MATFLTRIGATLRERCSYCKLCAAPVLTAYGPAQMRRAVFLLKVWFLRRYLIGALRKSSQLKRARMGEETKAKAASMARGVFKSS